MLKCVEFLVRNRWWRFDADIRGTFPVAQAFEFWMACVARDLLRLGVYFRAQAIMIQIPGAADYHDLCPDDVDENRPAETDDPYDWLHGVDRGTVLGVLAECLRRLDAAHILKRIPDVKRIRPKKLSAKWHKYLDRLAEYECGLLNVVAECLDELIVRPGFAAIDCGPQTTWWQDYWSKIKD